MLITAATVAIYLRFRHLLSLFRAATFLLHLIGVNVLPYADIIERYFVDAARFAAEMLTSLRRCRRLRHAARQRQQHTAPLPVAATPCRHAIFAAAFDDGELFTRHILSNIYY